MTPFRESILLLAAAWLVRDDPFYEAPFKQRIQDLVPELGAIGPSGDCNEFQQGLVFLTLVQNFNLVPT